MFKAAEFSYPDRRHRFTLTREWDGALPTMLVIGLNPSTADENTDDPTIRRCIRFAQREGCGRLLMMNVFSFRSTNPKPLYSMDWDALTCGGFNIRQLRKHTDQINADRGGIVLGAWGVHGKILNAANAVMPSMNCRIMCLGFTKDGQPRHPLYVRGDQPLEIWVPNKKSPEKA